MIMPDKNIVVANSFLGIGASILDEIKTPCGVGILWQLVKDKNQYAKAWGKFILALDVLYVLNLIEFKDGKIRMRIYK